MHSFNVIIPASLAALAIASPLKVASPVQARDVTTVTVSGTTATSYPQPAYNIAGFPIHSSCNATERNQLEKAFEDTIKLSQTAANYVLAHGMIKTTLELLLSTSFSLIAVRQFFRPLHQVLWNRKYR